MFSAGASSQACASAAGRLASRAGTPRRTSPADRAPRPPSMPSPMTSSAAVLEDLARPSRAPSRADPGGRRRRSGGSRRRGRSRRAWIPSTSPSTTVWHRDAAPRVQRRVEEHLAVLEVAELHAVLERLVGRAGEVLLVDAASTRPSRRSRGTRRSSRSRRACRRPPSAARRRACARGRRTVAAARCPRSGSAARPWGPCAGTPGSSRAAS